MTRASSQIFNIRLILDGNKPFILIISFDKKANTNLKQEQNQIFALP